MISRASQALVSGSDLNDLGLHDIALSGSHISHEPRRSYPEFTQDKLNPIIDVSSGSDGIWHTYLPFEVSIGNGKSKCYPCLGCDVR